MKEGINLHEFFQIIAKSSSQQKVQIPISVISGTQKEYYESFFQLDKFKGSKDLTLEPKGLHKILCDIFPVNLNSGTTQISYQGYEVEDNLDDLSTCIKSHYTYGRRASLKLILGGRVDIKLKKQFEGRDYSIEWLKRGFKVIPMITGTETFLISSGSGLNPPIERCPVFNIGLKNDEALDKYNLSNLKIYFLSDYLERMILKSLQYLKRNFDKMAEVKTFVNPINAAYKIAEAISICIYSCLTDPHTCPPVSDTNPISRLSQQKEVTHIGPFGLKRKRSDVNRRHIHYTHYGRLCPLETPESESIGLILHLTKGAEISPDGSLLSRYNDWDKKTAETEKGQTIGCHADKGKTGESLAWIDGVVKPEQTTNIQLWERFSGHFLGYGASLIPFIQHNDPVRATMGAKNIKQALELSKPEEPLIKTGVEKEIKKELNIGKNLIVAYMPWYGYNYEDGIVVSEKILEKLSTEKKYKSLVIPVWGNEKLCCDLKKIKGRCVLTSDGLAITGSEVYPGDTIARIHEIREFINEVVTKSDFREEKVPLYMKGKVIEAVYERYFEDQLILSPKTLRGVIKIKISEERELKVGDKLMGRHGNKGIVAKILPERETPYFLDPIGTKDQKGNDKYHNEDEAHTHVEVILNPHGVISRMNLGQLMETHMGLVISRAKNETRDYFRKEWLPFEKVDLKRLQNGLKETGIVNEKGKVKLKYFKDGKLLETKNEIVMGYQYIMKLNHMVEDKYHARNTGSNATITGQALKGRGNNGGMRFGEMEVWALQSHGAVKTLHELVGEKSDDPGKTGYTRSLQAFVMYLRGLGLSLEFLNDKGTTVSTPQEAVHAKISFADDNLILRWSHGEVKNRKLPRLKVADTRKGKKVEIIFDSNGLFSQEIFGKEEVLRFWKRTKYRDDKLFMGNICLEEPVINPIFTFNNKCLSKICCDMLIPVRMGTKKWSKKKGTYILSNHSEKKVLVIDSKSADVEEGTIITIDNYKKHERKVVAVDSWELCKNTDLLEKYKIVEDIDKIKNAFIKYVPVIPITLRPYLYDNTKNTIKVNDLNDLYTDVITANERLKRAKEEKLSHASILKFKEKLEIAVNNLFLFGKVDNDNKFRKSISDILKGKKGLLRQSILGKRCNYSGRSVIVPDPYIKMDEIVIPWEIGKVLYPENKDIIKMNVGEKIALEGQFVLMTRAPSLHKYSVQAFNPVIEKGTLAIKINPSLCQGFNADFDGDQMSIFTLHNKESIQEAQERLVPQKNLLSVASGNILPSMSLDIRLGIYLMFNDSEGQALLKKVMEGDVSLDTFEDKIKYMVLSTNSEIAREKIEILLQKAFEYATNYGMSFGMFDFQDLDIEEDVIHTCLSSYWEEYGYENIKMVELKEDEAKKYKQIVDQIENRLKDMLGIHKKSETGKLKTQKDNPLSIIYISGAKKDDKQIMQLIGAKGFVGYPLAKETLSPIKSNYFKGLHPFEYFASTYQARNNVMDKKMKTAPSGYLTRRLISAAYEVVISSDKPCDSDKGIVVELLKDKKDKFKWVVGRYLSKEIKSDRSCFPRNTLIDRKIFEEFITSGVSIEIRSPIYCCAKNGVCAYCYGWDLSKNMLPEMMLPVGIIAGQSVGERLTQLAMQSYHTGSAAGVVNQFDYIQRRFESKQHLFKDKDLLELLNLYDYKIDCKHFEVIIKCMENGNKSISEVALKQESFLSAASFARTMTVLSNAAYEQKNITLNGLKDKLILGKLI